MGVIESQGQSPHHGISALIKEPPPPRPRSSLLLRPREDTARSLLPRRGPSHSTTGSLI